MTTPDTRQRKHWLSRNKWLLARRISQTSIITAFIIGPLAGLWIVKGNLTASLTLNTLPLTDPYYTLQSLFASQTIQTGAIVGAVIVVVFYALVGGRVFCSWVCPVNIISDLAAWLRNYFKLNTPSLFKRHLRYYVLTITLILPLITGTIVWEALNPVNIIQRGIIFGLSSSVALLLAILLFDLFVSRRGWCSHLCPTGAFYSLLGCYSILRVTASKRSSCNNCNDCFRVCPEQYVISPALFEKFNNGPLINDINCTNCGRCIDVCHKNVFTYTHRFKNELINSSSGD